MKQQLKCKVIKKAIDRNDKMKEVKRMVKRIYRIINTEEMQILPGQLAFFIVFSLIVIFTLIGLICSNYVTHELITSIEETLPSAVSSIFKSLIETENEEFNIIVFVIVGIFIASNGCSAMIITSNALYKIKNDNLVKQKIKAIIMTIILILLILFTVLIPAFGDLVINLISNNFPGKVIDVIEIAFTYLKTPISCILIFIGVKIIYTLAPDKTIPSKYNNHGAIFTTFGWIIATEGYSLYLNSINTYNVYYGSLANIVILLFWVYLLAYIFTLGIAFNNERYIESQKVSNKSK